MSHQNRSGQHISHYQVDAFLSSGGMGDVYCGTDARLGRRVALKFLHPLADPAMRQRFLREAQAASSLDHPNICTIFDVEETEDGEIFIAMAYYDGETLAEALGHGPFELSKALDITIQTARGLAAAHEEQIVHRDIKPANLMLTQSGTVKILDFGIAKQQGDPRVVEGGAVVGTPAYMSPEQLRGEPVDHRTDIWSLGVVLYEMLAGSRPFRGDDTAAVIDAVIRSQPSAASSIQPGIPSRIDRILEKALTKQLRHRYERIDSMAHDLIAAQTSLDSDAITLRKAPVNVKTSIAVLPFEDMSPSKDQEFLCDGIAEEILRALSRTPDLYVASRTSAFQYKHRAADIREIGMRLNVSTILEGSVRRAGDRLRISAQLINVENGYRLWYERYDREMTDIFDVEDDIAEQIAQALKVTLVGSVGQPSGIRTSSNAEAYELYLQGRQFFHQHRRKAFEIALQTFSQAIDIDPSNARAFAGIAECHSFLNLYFGKGAEAITAADVASARALELEPNLADAQTARGLALFLRRDFEQAEEHLRRAIELDPQLYDAHYIYGRVCFSMGKAADAALHFREACRIVPEAYDSWYLLGMSYRRMGESERARRADLECIEGVNTRVRSHPDDTRAWTMGASVLAELGEPERASEWVARALSIDPDEPIIQYNAACTYTALGKVDEALACLEVAIGQSGISKDWVRNDPDLDPLRADPRFQAILAQQVGKIDEKPATSKA